jgi:hypothetical protein
MCLDSLTHPVKVIMIETTQCLQHSCAYTLQGHDLLGDNTADTSDNSLVLFERNHQHLNPPNLTSPAQPGGGAAGSTPGHL